MRHKLALASLGLGIAGALLPATSASAYCDPALSELTGRCTNGCVEAGKRYQTVDDKTGDRLPDYYDVFSCLA